MTTDSPFHSENDVNEEIPKDGDKIEELSSNELWKQIGFVRPLGGLLYNIIFVLGGAGIGLVFTVWLIPNIVYPFPAAMGWEAMTKSLFQFYFTMADVGVGIAIQRFIGEINVKKPKKTIQYLQFFVYFQMFTGLIQVTAIGFWALCTRGSSDLAYATWFFLLYSTIQWPGMLGVFTGALQAFQRFDKANVVQFIQAILLENTTRILCILLGRWLGSMNPEVGELMGATMGSVVGAYIDDFISAVVAGYWLRPILKDIDEEWSIWYVFKPHFDSDVVKECLVFGIKTMVTKVIFPFANLLSVFILTSYLPGYSTIWGIYTIADMIGGLSGTFIFDITSSFSEAYNNGKMKLAQDYIARVYRWTGLLGGVMVGLMWGITPLFGVVAGEQFASAVPMMRGVMIFKMMEAIIKYHDRIFQGGGKPEYNILVMIVEQASRIGLLYLFLIVFPMGGMSIVLSRGLGWVIKWFVSYWLINKRIIEIRINLWQTIVAPLIPTVLNILFVSALVQWLYPAISLNMNDIFAVIIVALIGLGIGTFVIWFPLYGYFGGWDDYAIDILRKAKKISGPSKPFVEIILKISTVLVDKSPFHNRFATDTAGIEEEIEDLVATRRIELEKSA